MGATSVQFHTVPTSAMKLQISIAQLLAIMVPLAVGLAAIANPTPFWEASIFALTLLMLFTAVVAAIYRTNGARAFWLGFSLFGWGFYALSSGDSFVFHSRARYPNYSTFWSDFEDDGPPLRSFTKYLVDHLQLYRATVPKSPGEKVQVQWGGALNYYPSSVLEIKNNLYKIRYDSDPQGAFDEWVGAARIRLGGQDRSYRISELLFILLFALAGALIACTLYATRKINDPDNRPHRQSVP
jgi:hypothetical protein